MTVVRMGGSICGGRGYLVVVGVLEDRRGGGEGICEERKGDGMVRMSARGREGWGRLRSNGIGGWVTSGRRGQGIA